MGLTPTLIAHRQSCIYTNWPESSQVAKSNTDGAEWERPDDSPKLPFSMTCIYSCDFFTLNELIKTWTESNVTTRNCTHHFSLTINDISTVRRNMKIVQELCRSFSMTRHLPKSNAIHEAYANMYYFLAKAVYELLFVPAILWIFHYHNNLLTKFEYVSAIGYK